MGLIMYKIIGTLTTNPGYMQLPELIWNAKTNQALW